MDSSVGGTNGAQLAQARGMNFVRCDGHRLGIPRLAQPGHFDSREDP
jgi:hypothetical protein